MKKMDETNKIEIINLNFEDNIEKNKINEENKNEEKINKEKIIEENKNEEKIIEENKKINEEKINKKKESNKKEEKKIMITGINENDKKKYTKYIEKLGGKVTENPKEMTHLITDSIKRTVKFLIAISNSTILSVNWIVESNKKKMFLKESDYLLKDEAAEKKFNFKLSDSVANRNRLFDDFKKLFTGLSFFISNDTKPGFF
jgi:mediator of DNA damage checkpoint protein 1